MKYVHSSVVLVFCFFIWSGGAATANTTASANGFLKQLLGAEYHGMGGSFVGVTRGADALGSNPAGIGAADGNRFVLHTIRFPRTIAFLSKPNLDSNYEDYSRFEQRASGIEMLNWIFPMGKFGALGLAIAFGQEGPFRRVDYLGKAINSFPENNLAIGFGYGVNILRNTVVGFDAKWLRSKVADTDAKEDLGHGYAYNVGIIQQFGSGIQIGIAARNLSNGLSFSNVSIPDRIERTFVAGIAYQREMSDITLRIGLDAHPPFRDGVRANIGAEVWYRNRIGGRIGYLRHTEKRYGSVFLLQDASVETEERLWKAEGVSFGLGFRFGNMTLNGAYTPQFKPTVAEMDRLHVVQGEAVYTFSIGQAF
jgi:hypothetical protein